LGASGYIAMGGQIIDATVVAAPKQRNTEDEKRALMGLVVRTIGLARARVKIGLANLVYNMRRFVWLSGKTAEA
jgi:hypothetical protein